MNSIFNEVINNLLKIKVNSRIILVFDFQIYYLIGFFLQLDQPHQISLFFPSDFDLGQIYYKIIDEFYIV